MDEEPVDDGKAAEEPDERCPVCFGDLASRDVRTGETAKPGQIVLCRWCATILEISEAGKPERVSPTLMEELERGQGLGPLDLEFPHVAHVEQADGPADGAVLLDDRRVLDRHLPAGERDHPRAGGDVAVVQGGPLERLAHRADANDASQNGAAPVKVEPWPGRRTGS